MRCRTCGLIDCNSMSYKTLQHIVAKPEKERVKKLKK